MWKMTGEGRKRKFHFLSLLMLGHRYILIWSICIHFEAATFSSGHPSDIFLDFIVKSFRSPWIYFQPSSLPLLQSLSTSSKTGNVSPLEVSWRSFRCTYQKLNPNALSTKGNDKVWSSLARSIFRGFHPRETVSVQFVVVFWVPRGLRQAQPPLVIAWPPAFYIS